MKQKYQTWIDSYQGDIHLQCVRVTEEMSQEFPELLVTKGLAILDISHTEEGRISHTSQEPHIWLTDTENDDIIDPTKSQWEDKGLLIIEYKSFPEETLQMGRCPNCGNYFPDNDGQTCCSESCHNEYVRYVMSC